MTEAEIGRLAVELQRAADAVRKWMHEEGLRGELRQNNQAPMWADYIAAKTAFNTAVSVYVASHPAEPLKHMPA